MSGSLTPEFLAEACSDDSFEDGISLLTTFESLGGEGSTVKPAIYEGGVFQNGTRWIPGSDGGLAKTPIIVIDNEASQANRLEGALLAFREKLGLPHFSLDLAGLNLPPHLPRKLSSLQFPHRNADAYLRDSELDGKPFMKTVIGKQIFEATPDRPEALYQWMPYGLLYGFWQSHLGKKGAQTKLARSWTSSIIGIDPASDDVRVNGTKGDPLNLSISQALEYSDLDLRTWSVVDSAKAKGSKQGDSLAEIGHGQVPFAKDKQSPAGISFRSVQQQSTVSFASLRRVSCVDPDMNGAGRALLVALGLAAHVAAFGRAVSLRSGCDLRPTTSSWTQLSPSGDTSIVAMTMEQATALLQGCISQAAGVGLPVGRGHWVGETLLQPNPQLRKAIELSYPNLGE
jgi:CRISPR-associated protein Csb1